MAFVPTVFYSYAHKDENLRDALAKHLEILRRQGLISAYHDREITAGTEWVGEIDHHLDTAEIILLLISPDFLASDYCYDLELERALERHEAGEATVIPVILRPCMWERGQFEKLQALPTNAEPVTSDKWPNEDTAFLNVAKGILRVVDKLIAERSQSSEARRPGATEAQLPIGDVPNERPAALSPRQNLPADLHGEKKFALGVDVGSSKIAVALFRINRLDSVSERGLSAEDVRHPVTVRGLLNQVEDLIEQEIKKEDIALKELRGIGIAAPGQVNLPVGVLEFGPGLGIKNAPLKHHLEEVFKVPVRVDNDARCATRCELYFGAGRRTRNFACIFIGTGVGSGIVIDGSIYYGENFCAGEIGHSTLDIEGPLCNCGRRGCLEVYVNGPAIVRRAAEIAEQWKREGRTTQLLEYGKKLDAKLVAEALENKDEVASQATQDVARRLGAGIANYVNTLNPGEIVLGGGLMKGFYEHMANDIREIMKTHCLQQLANTTVSPAKFMDTGAVIGAACLFHNEEKWKH